MKDTTVPKHSFGYDATYVSENWCGCGCAHHTTCFMKVTNSQQDQVDYVEYVYDSRLLEQFGEFSYAGVKPKITNWSIMSLYKFYLQKYDQWYEDQDIIKEYQHYYHYWMRQIDNYWMNYEDFKRMESWDSSRPRDKSESAIFKDQLKKLHDYLLTKSDKNPLMDSLITFLDYMYENYEHEEFLVKDDRIPTTDKNIRVHFQPNFLQRE